MDKMQESTYAAFVQSRSKAMGTEVLDAVHMSLGIAGEGGEIVDAVKKTFVYNKELDVANLKEELGDVLFYVQGMCNIFGWTLGEVISENVAKLEKRYPQGYTDAAAQARADKAGEGA